GLLLYFARRQYLKVNGELASMTEVQGLFEGIAPETGNLTFSYQLGEMSYRFWASRPFAYPKIRPGDRVAVVVPPGRPAEGRLRHWSTLYVTPMVLSGFVLFCLLLAYASYAVPGRSQARVSLAPSPVAALEAPIELHTPGDMAVTIVILAIVAFCFAALNIFNPETLWTRWLAYPAAFLAVILGIALLFASRSVRQMRIRADENGIEVIQGSDSRRIRWSDVAGLKMRRTYREEYSGPAGSTGRGKSKVRGEPSLIFLDKAGRELLELRADWAPSDQCRRLFDYIPVRTGLSVQKEVKRDLF
ncbi:MAG: hypothetical protein NT090_16275, partial [Acidobacteria bacterium]|nr:hypothetical protein [Acidobacteriota bacterium]